MEAIEKIKENSATVRGGYEHLLDGVANYIVKVALWLKIKPIQLTFFWVIAQFLVTFIFLFAEYKFFVLGIFLFQFMFLFDLSDGKLYRFYTHELRQRKPLFPKYLDRLGHFLNNGLLFICLGIGVYWRSGQSWHLYMGLFVAFLYLANKAITVNPAWYKSIEEQNLAVTVTKKAYPLNEAKRVKQFIFDIIRVEHFGNILFFGLIFDIPHYTLVFYAIVFFIEFLRKLLLQAMLLWVSDKII